MTILEGVVTGILVVLVAWIAKQIWPYFLRALALSKPKTQVIILLVCISLLGVLILSAYAIFQDNSAHVETKEVASFHVIGGKVAFNSRNQNQLIANTYIQNDAGEADIAVYSFGGIAKAVADEQQVINGIRKIVLDLVKQRDGLHFTVGKNEAKWFTVESPILLDEQVQQFKKGELAFYFVALVVITEQKTTKVLEHCGFVIGDRPGVILNCPSFAKKD